MKTGFFVPAFWIPWMILPGRAQTTPSAVPVDLGFVTDAAEADPGILPVQRFGDAFAEARLSGAGGSVKRRIEPCFSLLSFMTARCG